MRNADPAPQYASPDRNSPTSCPRSNPKGLLMHSAFARCLASCTLLLAANSASACCLWPFCGWGMGYGPAYPMAAPAWGGYSTYYTPWYAAPVGPAWNGCCPTSCCDPCNNCPTGACGTPTQNTAPTSGSLKPKSDPAFQERRPTPGNNDTPASSRTLPPVENLEQPADTAPTDTFTPTPPARRQPAAPTDNFTPPADPANPAEPAPFDTNDSISNKPPVSDPGSVNPTSPADETNPPADSFLPPAPADDQPATTNPQARRSPKFTPSRLAEVAAPKRLAGAVRGVAPGTAGRENSSTASRDRLRWISNPAPESHVRL